MKKHSLWALTTGLLIATSGCAVSLGNRENPTHGSSTLGQELMDLKKAKDAGVISEEEFQHQRERLLHHHHAK